MTADLGAFQRRIADTFGDRDAERGLHESFGWFVEEVGELSRALRRESPERQREEFSDVLAWLASLAHLAGVDLAEAASRYDDGCPRCASTPCHCAKA